MSSKCCKYFRDDRTDSERLNMSCGQGRKATWTGTLTQVFLAQKPSSELQGCSHCPLSWKALSELYSFTFQYTQEHFLQQPWQIHPRIQLLPCSGIYCLLRPDQSPRQLYLCLFRSSITIFIIITIKLLPNFPPGLTGVNCFLYRSSSQVILSSLSEYLPTPGVQCSSDAMFPDPSVMQRANLCGAVTVGRAPC